MMGRGGEWGDKGRKVDKYGLQDKRKGGDDKIWAKRGKGHRIFTVFIMYFRDHNPNNIIYIRIAILI